MTDEGELQHFLNVRVRRTRSFIQLDQAVYAQKVLDRFHHFIGSNQKTRRYHLPADAVSRNMHYRLQYSRHIKDTMTS